MSNAKYLLITLCLFLLAISANAQNDYGHKSYGIFVHYGFGATAEDDFGCTISQYADGSLPQSVDEVADNFDVQGFVTDLNAMSPEYLIFTIWHCGMNPLYPSDVMNTWLGSAHSGSERDVMQEILDACDAIGVDVYFYTQPSIGNSMRPTSQEAIGWINNSNYSETYNDFINEVYAEIATRYQSQLKGFWFDKGLGFGCVDADRLGETIRAIIPNAVMIKNGFASDAPGAADFGAVEVKSVTVNLEDEGYPNADDKDVNTWPAFDRSVSIVSDRDWFSNSGSIRYTSEEMYKYTVLEAGVNGEGGGVAWSLGPYPTTTISWNNGIRSGMTGLGTMIDAVGESIKGTAPSDSWPTPEGTRIQELTWGIATRSADDNYEYLHVLKAPSGTTLTIAAPADGRTYTSAINLRTGNPCSFSQTSNQISITLNASDTWDPVDAVIKLTSDLVSNPVSGPGYAGEWKKTRLYGHSYNSGDFTDEEYDWIRDHFEFFTVEKTHLRSIYGNPSHEETSRITATKLIEANPRCKPLMIYSIGSAYPQLFESEAEILISNPEYFTYDAEGEADKLNVENPGQNDWYIETLNKNTDSSDLYGTFLDGYKGTYTAFTENVQYMSDRITGYRLVNGMDFAPNGLTIRGWPECLEYSDGVFIDAFFRRRVMTKDAGVVLLDACMEIPNDQMFVCFSAYDGYSSTFEFSHAAYLIVAHENTYYRWVDEGDHLWNSSSLMTWKDVFDNEMGAPLGKAVKNGYVYTRVFEHCTVTLDVENITSSIVWNQNNVVITNPDYENVALDGSASQSTTAYGGDASRAIDGNTNGVYNNGSVSHTDVETQGTWWMVTLDNTYTIGNIVVYNRTGSNTDRLSNFTVEVLDENEEIVFTQTITNAPNPSVTINAGDIEGMQVRILQNIESTALTLAEVEVYGYTSDIITDISLKDESSFNIYPNPVQDILSVELGSVEHVAYQILNTTGQIVSSGNLSSSSPAIDLSALTSGIYTVSLSSESKSQMKKIIKK